MKKNTTKKTATKNVTKTTVVGNVSNNPVTRKLGAGRPKGSNSTLLVNAELLKPLIEIGGQIPISTRFARLVGLTGSVFTSNVKSLADIAKVYQKPVTAGVSVVNLNETPEPVTT